MQVGTPCTEPGMAPGESCWRQPGRGQDASPEGPGKACTGGWAGCWCWLAPTMGRGLGMRHPCGSRQSAPSSARAAGRALGIAAPPAHQHHHSATLLFCTLCGRSCSHKAVLAMHQHTPPKPPPHRQLCSPGPGSGLPPPHRGQWTSPSPAWTVCVWAFACSPPCRATSTSTPRSIPTSAPSVGGPSASTWSWCCTGCATLKSASSPAACSAPRWALSCTKQSPRVPVVLPYQLREDHGGAGQAEPAAGRAHGQDAWLQLLQQGLQVPV